MTGSGMVMVMVVVATSMLMVVIVQGKPSSALDDKSMHPLPRSRRDAAFKKMREGEDTAQFWKEQAQETISKKLIIKPNTNVAKNVIMFLGDGMSIPTLMAARVWMNQKDGKDNGEENSLSFEKFPFTGLSKTYCVDKQVADSACTATAYLSGVKANEGTIGVIAAVPLGDCDASLPVDTHVDSIAKWSQLKGKKTGLVTTTRVTHASPAGVYSHIAHRDWENDAETATTACKDIAHQLIYAETGSKLNVILGGGRQNFYMTTEPDPEYPKKNGYRLDENLANKWKELKADKGIYVENREDLLAIPEGTEYVLGLFEPSHTQYELDRDAQTDPSLTEMVEKAISLLHNTEEGFFLFVEGGRIDHAHHDGLAQKALSETLEFSNAIQRAVDLTSSPNTLIVVTSDHAHTMSVSGYPVRGNDILGQPDELADDNIPYSTITYANGPGYQPDENGVRFDISKVDTHEKEFAFPSTAPLSSETHGGDDVGIFASGPWAHLLTGSIEQNVIPHVMAYAACVGDGATACDQL